MDMLEALLLGAALLGLISLFALFTWRVVREPDDMKIFHAMARREIEAIYDEVDGGLEAYTFFHPGHPDIWMPFTREEFEQKILASCEGPWNPYLPRSAKPADINYRIDPDRKTIYLLPISPNYSFEQDNRLHREEYDRANKAHAEHIAKYKSELR